MAAGAGADAAQFQQDYTYLVYRCIRRCTDDEAVAAVEERTEYLIAPPSFKYYWHKFRSQSSQDLFLAFFLLLVAFLPRQSAESIVFCFGLFITAKRRRKSKSLNESKEKKKKKTNKKNNEKVILFYNIASVLGFLFSISLRIFFILRNV